MILVDSSVWIDYFNGTETLATKKLDNLLGVQPVCTGDLILAEVLQGFRSDSDYQTAKNLLCSLPVHAMLGVNLSLKSTENFRLLRKQGITIRKTIDTMIATFCIENELPLLHSDKDFQPFQQFLGLQVV
ncbi:type II toxin-antitoxin system VapC family toxin [Candidatus Methylobacter oryzae]|uniref:PIN domain nuclease n=1 Tax=Candidatus Methylobacter oryzae TaxID=2497749 RepID=A0ABY3C8B1_9GAMM|nr:PIN domain nuclease [Candidatus Methylobacter oryzae]TRW92147.1 PIN domain nuclease [Candidatus Methylobacter oryzae]